MSGQIVVQELLTGHEEEGKVVEGPGSEEEQGAAVETISDTYNQFDHPRLEKLTDTLTLTFFYRI